MSLLQIQPSSGDGSSIVRLPLSFISFQPQPGGEEAAGQPADLAGKRASAAAAEGEGQVNTHCG